MNARAPSFGLLALAFALLCAPLLLSTKTGGYADDEDLYHLPAVRQIRAHWPALDLNRDALSAVSPGYPYVLATVSFVTGTERRPLRLVTWLLSLALLGLLWRQFPASAAVAGAALLPLATSNFFVKSASWIVTDNVALLCVAGALAASFRPPTASASWTGSAWGGAAVFLRQLHAWIAAPLVLRAIFAVPPGTCLPARLRAALPALVPLAVLGALVAAWHGLVPSAWQTAVAVPGAALTAPLCYLAAVPALLGVAYLFALPAESEDSGWRSPTVLAAAAAGLLLALVTPSDFNQAAGRWGGYLWTAAAHLPVIGGRSMVFLVLTPLGAGVLALLTRRLAARAGTATAALWLGSFLAWASTALASRLAFHRYFEPPILVLLVFWAALMVRGRLTPALRPRPLYALALAQLIVTLATAHYQTYGPALRLGR